MFLSDSVVYPVDSPSFEQWEENEGITYKYNRKRCHDRRDKWNIAPIWLKFPENDKNATDHNDTG